MFICFVLKTFCPCAYVQNRFLGCYKIWTIVCCACSCRELNNLTLSEFTQRHDLGEITTPPLSGLNVVGDLMEFDQ